MRGRIRDLIPMGNKTLVSLELEAQAASMDKLSGNDVSVEIKPFRERRSLDSNSYFHVLVGKIAEKLSSSSVEVKNHLLADYGQVNYLPDGALDWAVKPETFDWTKCIETHYQPTDRFVMDKDKKCPVYIVMRGSHTYNSAEMSRLIDGTVGEAKELGIETITPAQIAEMNQRWGIKHG